MRRYAVAVLAVTLALLLTSLLWPLIQPNASLLFFAAVMFSAWYGGFGPGLLSTVLSGVAIIYFFKPPGNFWVIDFADILRLIIFLLVSLMISSLNGMRKQTEEMLRKKEEQVRLITDSVPTLIAYIDTGKRYRFNNQAYQDWFGCDTAEVIGKHLQDVIGESAYQAIQTYVETALLGQKVTYEKAVTYKDGTLRDIRASYVPHFGKQHQVKGFIAVVDDISDVYNELRLRQKAEEALRHSEERLRLALDAAQMGTWDWNMETGEVTWSEYHERLFGLAPGTFEGTYDSFIKCVHPEDREAIARLLNSTLAERGIYEQEFRVVWDDKSIHWIAAKGKFFYDKTGNPVRMMGTVLDITNRKEAEVLLQRFALELEMQVEVRTAELASVNAALEEEIIERQLAEVALYQSQESIQKLYETVAAPHLDFAGKMQQLLTMGCDRFGLDLGILAQITGERYQVIAVQLSENLASREDFFSIHRGDVFELGNTYCSETLRAKEPVSFEQAGALDKWRGHPCYIATKLEAYIATPIIVSGEVYGTLNFSSPTPRQTPFEPADREFLQLIAQWVGGEIARKQAEEALYEREQQFKAVVDNTPDMIMRCDRDLRYAYVNAAVERHTGVPASELIGKTTEETGAPPELCQLWNETMQKVLTTGIEQIIEFQAWSVHGLRNYQSRVVPEFDKDGTTQSVLIVARDITEIKQAEEERAKLIREQEARTQAEVAQRRSAFFAEASKVLASSLDYKTTLKSVVNLAVPYLADWCAVDLINEDGTIDRVEVAHINPAKVELAHELHRRYPPENNPQSRLMEVLRTAKSEYVAEIPDSLLVTVALDEEYLQILRELNLKSYMLVPLRVRGRTLGAMTFMSAESMRRYNPDDLALAEELAYRAALAVDNSLLYRDVNQARAEAEKAADRTIRLQSVTAALSESLTPAQVAEVIGAQGVAALKAKSAFITMLSENGTELELLGAIDHDSAVLEQWSRFSINTPVPLAQAVRTGQPIWPEPIAARIARYPHLSKEYTQANCEAWISIPLLLKGRTVGGMSFSFAEACEFGEDDKTFTLTLAQQCAQALERARLYEAERNARAIAEAANRTKDEFLATLSHELRTPLNAMLGWTKLLRTRKFDEATAARALETIERNTKSLATLIEDVLDVSRIITGKLRLNLRPIEVMPVIDTAIDAVRSTADAKKIQLEFVFDPCAGLILGDPDRLQQIVWNLLSNAIKFTPQGGRVEVTLERVTGSTQELQVNPLNVEGSEQLPPVQPSTQYVQIRVSDTGKGISPNFLPYVFERFRQADSSITRSHGGLGLGLAIVRHLVEMHGGTVHAESLGEGKGATFIVNLPLKTVPVEANVPQQVSQTVDNEQLLENSRILDGLQLLVVDDEADARELLVTLLEQCGAQVTAVSSANEALKALERLKPDVLVSDIGMPLEDGYTLIRKVRAIEPEEFATLPALALTAYASNEDRIRALEAGFQKHLSKPIEPAELVQGIAQLAGRTSGFIETSG